MKKLINGISILFVFFIITISASAQPIPDDSLYLGQTPPGDTPIVFAPGIISLEDRLETYPTFSPDGKEMFFSVVNADWSKGSIFSTKYLNGKWIVPDTIYFSKNNYINWESSISPDGTRQFFTSNRPPSSNMDIWMIERSSDTTWSKPVRLNDPVNSNASDGSACTTGNKNLYFISRRGGGIGGSILYKSKLINNAYSQVENMGTIIKTGINESEPYMAPDESYLIFISETRPGGYGGWDLWICFKDKNNSWSDPVNMGPNVNTDKDEYGPRVTPEGKYLFFTRETRGKDMDIYWVSSSIIDRLKSTNSIK
jgi:Tol biopolymer transport system component